ncbi:MAG: poly-beta-1,6 N-acetyl-D-glucosamine export porin PgaA, partial [Piscirickettsiaceae bacterium]
MDDNTHQQALSSAKAGDYTRAILLIKPLAEKHPKPSRFFYDYLSILGWSGQHQQVITQSKIISLSTAPQYVLKTVAIAQRDQQLFFHAKRTYQLMIKRFPKSLDSKIGLSLILIDQKNYSSAKSWLSTLLRQYPRNISVLYALAYLHESQHHYLQALPVYEKILAIKPTDRFSQKNKILALNKLGASHLALSLIKNNTLFTAKELASIRVNMAAHRIRWGEIPVLDETKRYVETDIAINDIQQNILSNTRLFGATDPLTLNERFDLLVALRSRQLMPEVVQHYKQLIADKVSVPNYSKNAYCDALLTLRQPLNAQHCYRDILATGRQNVNTKIALFYALLENENIPESQQWIEKIVAEQPTVIKGADKRKILKGDPQKTQAETVNALSIAFAGNLEIAFQRFSTLHGAAPYNINLTEELANVYYWRGWPRKAQEEYLIGLHQEPKYIGLRRGQARNWQALKEYPLAEKSINRLYGIFPENVHVAKQKKLWDIHNFREFKTDISSGKSNGGTNGSRDFTIDSYLYSSPFDYNYRAFIHQRHSQADFTEGDGLLNHAGIGLEYTAPNILLSGELHHNRFD